MSGISTENLEKWCASNPNKVGVKAKVLIVEACGVLTMPQRIPFVAGDDSTQYFVDDNIVLKPGYAFKEWNFRYPKEEDPFNFEQTGDIDQTTTTIAGQFFVPGTNPKRTRNMNLLSNGEWIVLYWDENNEFPYLIGEEDKAAILRAKKQHKPKSGFLVTASGELNDFPPFYRGTITYE